MSEFIYSSEEINEIKNRLDLIKGKLLMTGDDHFCVLTNYSIGEKEITEGWFRKKKKIVYYITLLEINYGNSIVQYTEGVMCSHVTITQLIHMKELADDIFKRLKRFNYTISKIEKNDE